MKVLMLLFLFFPLFNSVHTSGSWLLVKEQDGIKMYNRPSATSKFNDIKIETDFVGTLSQMGAILANVEKYTEWAYATKESVIVKKISPTEFIYYSVVDVPWPANDRDYYAHCKITLDSAAHTLKVVSASIKNYLPEKKNIVRIPLSTGTWNITAITNKKIHIEYILELDPGGSVPAWLLNLFSTKGPMETFESLKKKMKQLNP